MAALALTLACAGEPRCTCREGSLALGDFVLHQRSNVSTDLVSVPEGVGLDRFVYGWRIDAGMTGGAP